MPLSIASSTAYWTKGLSIIGSISLGVAFDAGKNLVPKPATGNTAFLINLYSHHKKTFIYHSKQNSRNKTAKVCIVSHRAKSE